MEAHHRSQHAVFQSRQAPAGRGQQHRGPLVTEARFDEFTWRAHSSFGPPCFART
jgi:hypothetical protein